MDLRHIRSFIAVYEEGSINRAATRLNCAQPSLSLQLRNLEEQDLIKLNKQILQAGIPKLQG